MESRRSPRSMRSVSASRGDKGGSPTGLSSECNAEAHALQASMLLLRSVLHRFADGSLMSVASSISVMRSRRTPSSLCAITKHSATASLSSVHAVNDLGGHTFRPLCAISESMQLRMALRDKTGSSGWWLVPNVTTTSTSPYCCITASAPDRSTGAGWALPRPLRIHSRASRMCRSHVEKGIGATGFESDIAERNNKCLCRGGVTLGVRVQI